MPVTRRVTDPGAIHRQLGYGGIRWHSRRHAPTATNCDK